VKILYITPNATDPLAFYRGTGPLARMRRDYPGLEFTSSEAVSWATLVSHDLVFMQRPFNAQHAEVIDMCNKWGVPVVSDFDDWLYDLMPDNPAYSLYRRAVPALETARLGSAAITVSTEHMKRLYAERGSDSIVVPNAYDADTFTPADATDRRKIVLWRGGNSHTQDLLSVRSGWLELIRKHADWQFMFMNCHPWWLGETFENVKHLEGMSIIDYMSALGEIRPAIMTHPLLDSDFNRAKSMCSYIEAAHAGAAFVGPDFEEFVRPGLERYTPDSGESFFAVIDRLIEQPERIVANARLAQAEITGPLSLRQVNRIRWETFKRFS